MSDYISVERAAEFLLAGELVAFPTETVYGLGANALDPEAVARIFQAKGRPSYNPIICHLPDLDSIFAFSRPSPEEIDIARVLEKFWPGPLTLLLPRGPEIPDIVTAGRPLCGFRIPDQPLALELLLKVKVPLAAPSANLSGRRSPTTAAMTAEQLGDAVAGILDGGVCGVGLESTVVKPEPGGILKVLRYGGLSLEELRGTGFRIVDATPTVPAAPALASSEETRTGVGESPAPFLELEAPGGLSAHYAPACPLLLLERDLPEGVGADEEVGAGKLEILIRDVIQPRGSRLGVLIFGDGALPLKAYKADIILNLSEKGNFQEAARRLFYYFDLLDRESVDLILAQKLPDEGLGRAINDRLFRAASFLGFRRNDELFVSARI